MGDSKMKKFALVLSLLMLLPFNALALQTLSEDDMGGITGQAGVSIAIDDVKLYQNGLLRFGYAVRSSDYWRSVFGIGTEEVIRVGGHYFSAAPDARSRPVADWPDSGWRRTFQH